MERASVLAQVDIHRAATHNKGVMNGIHAVVLATGNDTRGAEASAHAYASRDGQYRGSTNMEIRSKTSTFNWYNRSAYDIGNRWRWYKSITNC